MTYLDFLKYCFVESFLLLHHKCTVIQTTMFVCTSFLLESVLHINNNSLFNLMCFHYFFMITYLSLAEIMFLNILQLTNSNLIFRSIFNVFNAILLKNITDSNMNDYQPLNKNFKILIGEKVYLINI